MLDTGSRVRVDGRDETGTIVTAGVNIGNKYCVAVYFETTGEVAYYVKTRVREVDG